MRFPCRKQPQAMTKELKLITIALRDFALPVPRFGSIEALSGYGPAAREGQEIHSRVQRKRRKADPAYESEVAVSHTFDRGGYGFRITGRMDGIFHHDPAKIEEIKTGFAIRELAARLAADPFSHPYGLQLLTYGYIHGKEQGRIPLLSFHLVSSRSKDALDLPIAFDLAAYERWLDARLNELVEEARAAEKRAARRRKIAASFPFPFPESRPGQREMIATIEEGIRQSQPMLLQAPTGLGKTVGVLFPVLQDALDRGQRTVYVTPKNSQHAVAEDAVNRFHEAGAKIKSLTITAKSKICFQNEPLCDPAYCEFAEDYYGKVQRGNLLGLLSRKRRLTARAFRSLGEEYEVCPFELQLDAAVEADLIICDYNYVFAPRSAFRRIAGIGVDQEGRPNLVIDECHNLPSRAMDYYSPSLSTVSLEQLRPELRALAAPFCAEAQSLLNECIGVIVACRPENTKAPARIEPPVEAFLEQDLRLRSFLSRYLDRKEEIERGDPVLRLCFSWSEFSEALALAADAEWNEFFFTFHPSDNGGIVKITCCDASAMIADRYDDYEQTVGFSATLKPFEYYARLSGLDPGGIRTAEFASPFDRDNRKLLIIPQVSTKYADRERNYGKIAEAVGRIAAIRPGNYFVFFPSFEFLDRVCDAFPAPEGFRIVRQHREMKAAAVEEVLETLREGKGPTIVFAVQGGSFAEGVDYPGHMAIGAFVIGPPLPVFDLERELMREYYQRQYRAGFDYAYAIPAMAKAVQAAGRVIRSETDRGLIVLMDSRFIEPGYARSMPRDWFESHAGELVSESILQEVKEFWERG